MGTASPASAGRWPASPRLDATTVERNGSPDPVDFDDSDLFCLDGWPLLAT
ncbi:MAG: hypothetical protein R2873_19345 [Caldilineaceae bacterium]